jgi:hypothetical protein
MKTLLILLLLFSGCVNTQYVASVKTDRLSVLKTDNIEEVREFISPYLNINIDSLLNVSKYFGYYSKEVEIYAEKKR